MARKGEKTLVFKFDIDEARLEFVKRLPELKIPVNYYVTSKPKVVRIKLIGPHEIVKQASHILINLWKRINDMFRVDSEGMVRYHIDEIFKRAHATVQPELVVEALRMMGKKAEYSDKTIRTNASLDEVVNTARRLHELDEMVGPLAIRPVRNLAVLVSFLTGHDPLYVVERGLELGVLRENERTGKIELAEDREEAFRKLLEVCGS